MINDCTQFWANIPFLIIFLVSKIRQKTKSLVWMIHSVKVELFTAYDPLIRKGQSSFQKIAHQFFNDQVIRARFSVLELDY